ncbi:Phytanoyl-CoA dioxygenase [Parvibaculum lavamentivorans DS-1]|uniref:Phytanoyl-CoA dioxygenase n=1 Tax=Parvibaculum lavamentivorans (strain DS-1 / DSM 13023 / NCIMB 13966) TaxID=402881 RepID=A7HYD7_PARL1|nr:phytanoyl-CoA dioxygenase family protein [Parvibaculum lavamentivorans]ABS64920.1 Phytanoyl-CoA dioxygenase [Parvibaculum lavamentivorans DS-1]
MSETSHYGVKEQTLSVTAIDRAIEQLRLLGYAVLDGSYSRAELTQLQEAFCAARRKMEEHFGGKDSLEKIDEHNTIRIPMMYERVFLDLALNQAIIELCRRMIGDYFILNQQNGISNPGNSTRYNQGAFHRDLPYQHFVSDRPLAINALFCLDDFTTENGATYVLPGSHKQSAYPSDATVDALKVQIPAPAGSFIILDCMLYHSGGVNRTDRERRAVNHVYSIPMLKQQIDLPAALGDTFSDDPGVRQLLGYDSTVPLDVAAYYRSRTKKKEFS